MAGLAGNLKHISTERRDSWTRLAGEDIGIGDPDPDRYPLAPIVSQGIPVYISESGKKSINIEVSIITVADRSATPLYDGLTYAAAHSGEPVVIHCAGEVWLPCGYGAITAGDLVIWDINSTENSSGAVAGDVIPFDQASGASSSDGYSNNSANDIADFSARLGAIAGRALSNADARTDGDTFEYVLVRLKGW